MCTECSLGQIITIFFYIMWSSIATRLPGRTDNEIKNYWNTHLKKKLLRMGIDPVTHCRRTDLNILSNLPPLLAATNLRNLSLPQTFENVIRVHTDAEHLTKVQILQSLIQLMYSNYSPLFETTTSLLGSNGNQFGDIDQLNRQLEAVLNGSLSLDQAPINNLNLGNSMIFNNLQYKENVVKNEDNNSYANVWMPSLVSESPENVVSDQIMQELSNSTSSRSTQFEAWEGLNPDDDFGLKAILEQICWSENNMS